MFFGLINALITFKYVINWVFFDILSKNVKVYLDSSLIFMKME